MGAMEIKTLIQLTVVLMRHAYKMVLSEQILFTDTLIRGDTRSLKLIDILKSYNRSNKIKFINIYT